MTNYQIIDYVLQTFKSNNNNPVLIYDLEIASNLPYDRLNSMIDKMIAENLIHRENQITVGITPTGRIVQKKGYEKWIIKVENDKSNAQNSLYWYFLAFVILTALFGLLMYFKD